MRMPWVSRARYDLLEHNSRELVTMLRSSLAVSDNRAIMAESRLEALLEKYHALKYEKGATLPPTETVAPPPAPAKAADELKELIYNKAGANYAMRAMMLRQLAKDRAEGLNNDEIRRQIEFGIESTGVAL